MNMLKRRAVVSVALTLGLVLLAALAVGQYVVQKHWQAVETLEQIEPRYARLLGLRDTGAQLEEVLKQSRATLAMLGYGGERDAAQVGNDLQQVVRRAMQTAGLSVTSSQVLAPRSEAGFDRIGVSVQAEGALSAVQVALAALQGETPRLFLDSVVLQATGRLAEDGTPVVSCRLTAAVKRLQT
jgi:general secretion pathway protein M